MYNNSYQTHNAYMQAQTNNITLVKSYFKRKSVLVLGLLSLVSVICSVAITFLSSGIYAELWSALQENGASFNAIDPSVFAQFSSTNSIILIASSLFTALISGLFIAAFFIIYAKSKNPAPTANPKAGFTILFVFAVIALVLVCLYALFFLLMLLLFATVFSASSAFGRSVPQEAQAVLSIMMTIFALLSAVIFGAMLFYCINAVRFLGSIRYTLSNPGIKLKGVKPFGVFNIIIGVLSCAGSLFVLVMLGALVFGYKIPYVTPYSTFDFSTNSGMILFALTALFLVLNSVIYILYGTISLGYDKHIRSSIPRQPAPAAAGGSFYQSRPVHTNAQSNPHGFYAQRPANPYQPQQPANPYTQNMQPLQQPVNPYTPPQRSANPYIPPVAPPVITTAPHATAQEESTAAVTAEEATAPVEEQAADTAAKVCPGCNAPAEDNDLFCQKCGTKL